MSMLNQAAVEALCSATYLSNYLDCLDTLPDDLQRVISQMRELDMQIRGDAYGLVLFKIRKKKITILLATKISP